MNRNARIVAVVAGVAVIVALFLVLRPRDEEPEPRTSPTVTDVTPTTTLNTAVPPTTPVDEVYVIEAEFEDGQARGPARVPVARGQRVRITVTSDVEEEVHVHGYDLRADVAPGEPAVIEFVADASGVFEVELERSHVLLFRLEVGA